MEITDESILDLAQPASEAPAAVLSVNGSAALQDDHARRRALLAMFASAVLLSLMGVFTKVASRPAIHALAIPGGEIAFFRYTCGVGCLLFLANWKGVHLLGKDRPGLLWRGIAGGVASTAYFLGIQSTSLTHAALLNNTFVIWGSLFAVFTLGETLGLWGSAAVLTALFGVLLVTNPQIGHIQSGDLIALFSGIMAGLAVVQVRRLRRTESSLPIFFYFNLIGLPISLSTIILTHTAFVPPSPSQWLVLLGVGLSSVSGQLLMTYGFKELAAAQGSLISLTSVIFAALLSHLLFHEPFTFHTLFGGLLILAAAVALSLRPSQAPKNTIRID